MDILLLFPPLSVEERYGNRKLGEIGGHLPPFGLACIASYIREHSFSVGIMDALAEDMETNAGVGLHWKTPAKGNRVFSHDSTIS